jgi:hypothetical protein
MRQNDKKTNLKAQFGDPGPESIHVARDKGADHGKDDAVGRSPMKSAAITFDNETDNNIQVRQIGQDRDENDAFPANAFFGVFK